jgi:hypothetical protein
MCYLLLKKTLGPMYSHKYISRYAIGFSFLLISHPILDFPASVDLDHPVEREVLRSVENADFKKPIDDLIHMATSHRAVSLIRTVPSKGAAILPECNS